MQSLALALKSKGEDGVALPTVFKGLENLRAFFRRGQLSLIAGAPGGGKSAVATELAVKMKVPTLYFSADSDRGTLGIRMAAAVLGKNTEVVEELVENGELNTWEAIESELGHIWIEWDPSPTLRDIEEVIGAYVEVNGEYPHFIVIDNLKNMVSDIEAEQFREYDQIMEWLRALAGKTEAHVCVLHHVTGFYENGDQPIPLNGLLGKPGKACRLVLTLFKPEPGLITLCVVKNSNGAADATGNTIQETVVWHPETSFFAHRG